MTFSTNLDHSRGHPEIRLNLNESGQVNVFPTLIGFSQGLIKLRPVTMNK